MLLPPPPQTHTCRTTTIRLDNVSTVHGVHKNKSGFIRDPTWNSANVPPNGGRNIHFMGSDNDLAHDTNRHKTSGLLPTWQWQSMHACYETYAAEGEFTEFTLARGRRLRSYFAKCHTCMSVSDKSEHRSLRCLCMSRYWKTETFNFITQITHLKPNACLPTRRDSAQLNSTGSLAELSWVL